MNSQLEIGSRVSLNDGNSMPLLGLGVWDANQEKKLMIQLFMHWKQVTDISTLQKCMATKKMLVEQLLTLDCKEKKYSLQPSFGIVV